MYKLTTNDNQENIITVFELLISKNDVCCIAETLSKIVNDKPFRVYRKTANGNWFQEAYYMNGYDNKLV